MKITTERPEFSAQQRRGNVTLAYWNQQSYKDKKHRCDRSLASSQLPTSRKDSLHWDEKTNTDYRTDHQTSL